MGTTSTPVTPGSYGTTIPERAPTLQSTITGHVLQSVRAIRVSVPAIVQSFDEKLQTVTVKIALLESARIAGVPTTQLRDLILKDVPICIPRAGGFALTLPIEEGDECDLLFADGCIDAWFQSGGQQVPAANRHHNISDAIALFGLGSNPRKLTAYSTDSAQLRNDDASVVIDLADGQITITADTVNVNSKNATVMASQTATVTGQNVHITADNQVTIVSNGGNTMIDGKPFKLHEHTSVQTGGGISGPVA